MINRMEKWTNARDATYLPGLAGLILGWLLLPAYWAPVGAVAGAGIGAIAHVLRSRRSAPHEADLAVPRPKTKPAFLWDPKTRRHLVFYVLSPYMLIVPILAAVVGYSHNSPVAVAAIEFGQPFTDLVATIFSPIDDYSQQLERRGLPELIAPIRFVFAFGVAGAVFSHLMVVIALGPRARAAMHRGAEANGPISIKTIAGALFLLLICGGLMAIGFYGSITFLLVTDGQTNWLCYPTLTYASMVIPNLFVLILITTGSFLLHAALYGLELKPATNPDR